MLGGQEENQESGQHRSQGEGLFQEGGRSPPCPVLQGGQVGWEKKEQGDLQRWPHALLALRYRALTVC